MSSLGTTLDFETGQQAALPDDWASEESGVRAAQYINDLVSRLKNGPGLQSRKGLDVGERVWNCFRSCGEVKFRLTSNGGVKNIKRILAATKTKSRPKKNSKERQPFIEPRWDKANGEPLLWQEKNPFPLYKVIRIVESESCLLTGIGYNEKHSKDELLEWMDTVCTYQNPATSRWNAPFLCYKISTEVIGGEDVTVTVRLFLSRLIFYLIADEKLKDMFACLDMSKLIITPKRVLDGETAMFTRSYMKDDNDLANSDFTTSSLLARQENVGYHSLPQQPSDIALQLKDYQKQTVQWMIDQESLEGGLNGCFWEEINWPDSPSQTYFYSRDLGELRLEKPPLVRGGLVCEEMGLGKTLEFITLVLLSKTLPETPFTCLNELRFTNTSLFVTPDILLPQWQSEIVKSLKDPNLLRVGTLLMRKNQRQRNVLSFSILGGDSHEFPVKYGFQIEDEDTLGENISSCDIVLTNYNTVKRLRFLQEFYWRRVALDEMQEIRSSTTELARMCRKLASRARWMISGTPLYTGIDDLNGELAFLGVIPFSLPDGEDGFWGHRIKQPFTKCDQIALDLLKLLLDNVMIRHSKQQTYITDGSSILSLPSPSIRFVGVPLSLEERACYMYLESLTGLAVELQRESPVAANAANLSHLRTGNVGVELLRNMSISPTLINGGMGSVSLISHVAALARETIQLHRLHRGFSTDIDPDQPLAPDCFHALPCDELIDTLLSNVGASSSGSRGRAAYATNSGQGAGVSANAKLEHFQQKLTETQEKLKAANQIIQSKLCTRNGGILTKRLWQYAVQAVTSGKYFMVLAVQNKWNDLDEVMCQCPLIWRNFQVLLPLQSQVILAERRIESSLCSKDLQTLLKRLAKLDSEFEFELDGGSYLLYFDGAHTPVSFASNPSKWRQELERRISTLDKAQVREKEILHVWQHRFNSEPSEGVFHLELSPFVVEQFPRVEYEARVDTATLKPGVIRRAWYLVRELSFRKGSLFPQVTLLDGQVLFISTTNVRVKSSPPISEYAPKWEKSIEQFKLVDLAQEAKLSQAVVNRLVALEELSAVTALDLPSFVEKILQYQVQIFGEAAEDPQASAKRVTRLLQVARKVVKETFLYPSIHTAARGAEDLYERAAEMVRRCLSSAVAVNIPAICGLFGIESTKEVKLIEWCFDSSIPNALKNNIEAVNNFFQLKGTPREGAKLNSKLTSFHTRSATEIKKGTVGTINFNSGEVGIVEAIRVDRTSHSVVCQFRQASKFIGELSSEFSVPFQEFIVDDEIQALTEERISKSKDQKYSGGKRKAEAISSALSSFSSGRDVHSSLVNRKQQIEHLRKEILTAEHSFISLSQYEKILLRAVDRRITNAISSEGVVELQGLQALQQIADGGENPNCAICLSTMEEPVCTPCVHLFCNSCFRHYISANDIMGLKTKFTCPLCRRKIKCEEMYRVLPPTKTAPIEIESDSHDLLGKFEDHFNMPTVETLNWFEKISLERSVGLLKEACRGSFRVNSGSRVGVEALNSNFLHLMPHATGLPLSSSRNTTSETMKKSSKLDRVVTDLKEFSLQGSKSVVFSQFRNAILHLSCILEHENISFVHTLHGDPSANVKRFAEDPCVKVLLLQSSSQAAGLSLTMANKVLLLEPFVKAGEQAQALNRVHRIGQTKDVETRVYFSRGTVEERILVWNHEQEKLAKAGLSVSGHAETSAPVSDEQEGSNSSVLRRKHHTFSQRYLSFISGFSSKLTD